MGNENYYCKLDRRPHPDQMRIENITLLEKAIECPKICCEFCVKRFNCEFLCWKVELALKGNYVTHCQNQCTLQDKVFGKILNEKKEDSI